jgi:hypothetical protein
MNTKNQEIELISDDELDAVAGGMRNCETAAFGVFWKALQASAGQQGAIMLSNSLLSSM